MSAMSDIPADMTITMHMCRGNYKSTFMGAGGYDAVQEILFNKINVHGYFMEYDDARSGGFEPLRMLPKGKQVVLGIVTTKTGKLESKDDLKRRIDEAAKFAPLDQLCLSGQCGFASTEEGNVLTEDEQWAKLRRIVEVARAKCGDRHATHQTAVPRRPCRQLAAHRADQGRAREAREGRDHGRSAQGGRGRRDQKDHRASRKQCGLQLATDGEFRRSWWHFDFLCGLDGVEMKQIEHGIQFAGVQTKAERPDIVGKVGFSSHPMIEHFKFLKANTRVTPKMTIPSPTLLHFRFGRASITKTLYPDLDEFFDDLGADLRQGRAGVLRRRLPLSAVRRHHLGVPLLREGARAVAPARRQSGRAAGEIRRR